MNLTAQDLAQLKSVGISKELVEKQYSQLSSGPQMLDLSRACTVSDGIKSITDNQKQALISDYDALIEGKEIVRFTPASGAATRMFKHLFNLTDNKELVDEFIENIEDFAFFDELEELLSDMLSSTDQEIVDAVLKPNGLNYGKLPKALISFHVYENEIRKAIDEQLVEGVNYVKSNGVSKFHFTISPEHEKAVREHIVPLLKKFEKRYNSKFEISYSTQSKSTDTVALSENNELARKTDGSLLLRPGGHGALIHNLNNLDADVVFIKNIDNIVHEGFQEVVIDYKKVLGSILLNLQNAVFDILNELNNGKVSAERLVIITEFLKKELNITVVPNVELIRNSIHKPIRVCGMVKNQGKAGGGPFWVGDSVQIVETAQMDLSNKSVVDMLVNASHFNPVDLVCGLKDYQGKSFDLANYINEKTFFVSSKSFKGEGIKVLEHPGLWNVAMANWLTIFVEVPVETFHPVKTINDLLQEAHQPK